jgi:hypothetical protein
MLEELVNENFLSKIHVKNHLCFKINLRIATEQKFLNHKNITLFIIRTMVSLNSKKITAYALRRQMHSSIRPQLLELEAYLDDMALDGYLITEIADGGEKLYLLS